MFALDVSWLIDSVFIFTLAFLIDLVLGEYPDRIHPTIGIGKLIIYLKKKAKSPNPRVGESKRRLYGANYHGWCLRCQ